MDKCLLCYCDFVKPKILPCLDTFCFRCLDDYIHRSLGQNNSFPCPVCATEIAVPEGGVTKFEDNVHVKGDQALLAVSDTAPCEMCEDKAEAVNRCIDCEQNFCDSCSKSHLRLKLAKDHTLVRISGSDGKRFLLATAYCEKHAKEELTFYCRTCFSPICLRCRLTGHEDHTTEDLKDFAFMSRKELRHILDHSKNLRFSVLNEIEEMRMYEETVSRKRTEIAAAIERRREQFHRAVDDICEEMTSRLQTEASAEQVIVQADREDMEKELLVLSSRIATAAQIIDFGADIEIVRKRQDILGSLILLNKSTPIHLSGIKLGLDFTYQDEAEISLRYLLGRLSTDIVPPAYIQVEQLSAFRVEDSFDVINAICPTPEGKAWVVCGWKSEIFLFDLTGNKVRSKRVGRDVDSLAVDSDGNSYVSCRDERSVKRFDRNFRRRMATLTINCPRGIACTHDNKLVICVAQTPTYFDYNPSHENKVLKLGPDGDESKELKNPSLQFQYPIRVAVNSTGDLCVSDNLKHAVMILKENGELKATYQAENKAPEVAVVKTVSPRTTALTRHTRHHTSTPKPATTSVRFQESRYEQDGALSTTVSMPGKTPASSPDPIEAKALAPLNMTYGSEMNSSVTIESLGEAPPKFTEGQTRVRTAKSRRMDTLSLTEVMTEINFKRSPPFDPRGVTCDRFGHVIIADYSSNLVHMLDKHGRFLCLLLTEADGIFGPTSVAVDKAGLLWVGGGNAMVQVYRYLNTDLGNAF